MSRCLGRTWTCLLLLSAAGCTFNEFLSPQFVVEGPKKVVPGRVTQVAAKLESGLSDAGVMVTSRQAAGDLRIAGQSNSGTVFCIHLREIRDKKFTGSASTAVRMQWDRGGDTELWKLVLRLLEDSPAHDADHPERAAP